MANHSNVRFPRHTRAALIDRGTPRSISRLHNHNNRLFVLPSLSFLPAVSCGSSLRCKGHASSCIRERERSIETECPTLLHAARHETVINVQTGRLCMLLSLRTSKFLVLQWQFRHHPCFTSVRHCSSSNSPPITIVLCRQYNDDEYGMEG